MPLLYQIPDRPLLFLIPQGAREIAVTVLPGDQVQVSPAHKTGRKKPRVYQDVQGWVSYQSARPLTGLRFTSEADLWLAEQYLWLVFHRKVLYGYVRLTKADTEDFIGQHAHTCVNYPGSPGLSAGHLLTFQTGHVLLRNPHVDALGHGVLFTDYPTFLLEVEAMKEFMAYCDSNGQ
ncbi:MAG: hypothetical protein EOO60_04365 [Hymenobacter sp.]|nr:MAG: hypothetical protein EOO60_04365 [Hymenobacter sp.]